MLKSVWRRGEPSGIADGNVNNTTTKENNMKIP